MLNDVIIIQTCWNLFFNKMKLFHLSELHTTKAIPRTAFDEWAVKNELTSEITAPSEKTI